METNKIRRNVAVLAVTVAVLAFSCLSYGGEPAGRSSLRKISNLIFENLRKHMLSARDVNYQVTAVIGVRGFGAAEPYEKSAFRFGALSAELRYAESIPDDQNSKKIASLIVDGLNRLRIEIPGTKGTMSLAQLNPAMEKFVADKKVDDYFQLGQWVGAMRFAMLTAREGHPDMASRFLGSENEAAYFLGILQGQEVPQGVITNLKKLDMMKAKTPCSEQDVKDAISYLDNILLLLE